MNVENTFMAFLHSYYSNFMRIWCALGSTMTKPFNIFLVYPLKVMKSCFTINMHFSTIVRKDKNCAFFDGAISKQLSSVHCASTPIDHLAFWPRRPYRCFYICHIPNGKVQTHYWLKLNHSCFSLKAAFF